MLVWKTPRTEEPDGLQSAGLQRVGHHRVSEHTHTCFNVSDYVSGYVRVPVLRPSVVSASVSPVTVLLVGEGVTSSSALIVAACGHGRDGDSVYLRPQVTKMGGASYLQSVETNKPLFY